ncbi:MAG TPA: hypothetical protein VKA68_02825 [bacterium]|nr:hypothetical protein [bacterium]
MHSGAGIFTGGASRPPCHPESLLFKGSPPGICGLDCVTLWDDAPIGTSPAHCRSLYPPVPLSLTQGKGGDGRRWVCWVSNRRKDQEGLATGDMGKQLRDSMRRRTPRVGRPGSSPASERTTRLQELRKRSLTSEQRGFGMTPSAD